MCELVHQYAILLAYLAFSYYFVFFTVIFRLKKVHNKKDKAVKKKIFYSLNCKIDNIIK